MSKPTSIDNCLDFWRIRPWSDHQTEHRHKTRLVMTEHKEAMTRALKLLTVKLDIRP